MDKNINVAGRQVLKYQIPLQRLPLRCDNSINCIQSSNSISDELLVHKYVCKHESVLGYFLVTSQFNQSKLTDPIWFSNTGRHGKVGK